MEYKKKMKNGMYYNGKGMSEIRYDEERVYKGLANDLSPKKKKMM